jgi:hypothetical protein
MFRSIKMKHKLIILNITLCLVVFSSKSTIAQSFDGQFYNSKTKLPISYVSIGIPAHGIGFLSDEDGRFQLILQSVPDSDTLMFSIIGYKSTAIAVSDFKAQHANSTAVIYLEEKSYNLKEVSVRPKNIKFVTMGKIKSKLKRDDCFLLFTFLDTMQRQMISKKLIKDFPNKHLEVGSYFDIKPRETYLDKVNLQFCDFKFDTVKMRLNVYSNFKATEKHAVRFNGNENILTTPIYFTVIKGTEMYEIDLKPYSIKVFDDFIVTMETLEPEDCHKLLLPCHLFSSGPDMVHRFNSSQDYMYKLSSIKLALSVTIGYEK